jgi:hypothetical protein
MFAAAAAGGSLLFEKILLLLLVNRLLALLKLDTVDCIIMIVAGSLLIVMRLAHVHARQQQSDEFAALLAYDSSV